MSDAGKPFRKLTERPRMTLLRLPAWVRGYLDEMTRFAERPSGRICESTDPADVAFAIRAHDSEAEMLARAIAILLQEGGLTAGPSGLVITDFEVDQKNYEAERKRAYRAKQLGNANVPDAGDGSGTVPQDQRRSEEMRIPLTPKGGRMRKRTEDPEETRRARNLKHENVTLGRYGATARSQLEALDPAKVSAFLDALGDPPPLRRVQ